MNAATEISVLDTTMRVMTPENIAFEYQVAGPFRRVFAYGIDLVVSFVGIIVGGLLFNLLFFALSRLASLIGMGSVVLAMWEWLQGLVLVGMFLMVWFYGAVMETYFNGQTLGKRWTGLRVISNNGSGIDGVQATLRNFFRLLDVAPFLPLTVLFQLPEQTGIGIPTGLIGLVVMALDSRYRRVGDLVAGTVVIHEARTAHPSLVVFSDPRVPQLAELIPASFIPSPTMAQAIASYADQRRFLHPQRASEIARHLAAPLIAQMGLLPDTDHDLFLCSLYFKTFSSVTEGEGDEGEFSLYQRELPDAPASDEGGLQAASFELRTPETNTIDSGVPADFSIEVDER